MTLYKLVTKPCRQYMPLMMLSLVFSLASCTADKPYDEAADAKKVIAQAMIQAKNRHVPIVLIFGANWCPDCRALGKALEKGDSTSKIAQDFAVVKINVGNFDTNLDIAKNYGNPIEIGIPGAAFLSESGQLNYVAKAGELAIARKSGGESLYHFFKKVTTQSSL